MFNWWVAEDQLPALDLKNSEDAKVVTHEMAWVNDSILWVIAMGPLQLLRLDIPNTPQEQRKSVGISWLDHHWWDEKLDLAPITEFSQLFQI